MIKSFLGCVEEMWTIWMLCGQIEFSFYYLLHCTKDLHENIIRKINSNILQKNHSAIT